MKSKGHKFEEVIEYDLEELVHDQLSSYEINMVTRHRRRKFRVVCPVCGGKNLSVLPDYRTGICFRDNILFVLPKVIEEERRKETPRLEFVSGTLNLDNVKGGKRYQRLYGELDERGLEYLKGRNPNVRDWGKYLIKQRHDNLFLPFYFGDEIIYYQTRSIIDKTYRFPSGSKPLYVCGDWDLVRPTIIVEGIFDAIAVKEQNPYMNVIAVGGSIISDYQLNMLRVLGASVIFVFLDKTELSKKLRDSLPYENVGIIPSDGADPEERINKGFQLKLPFMRKLKKKVSKTVFKETLDGFVF